MVSFSHTTRVYWQIATKTIVSRSAGRNRIQAIFRVGGRCGQGDLTALLGGYKIKTLNPCYSFGYDKLTSSGESRYLFF